jgi:adenylate cyclase
MRVKRHLVRWSAGVAVLILLLGHAAGYYQLLFVDSLDNLIYDARLRLTMPRTRDDRIAIVDIDERSLAEVGRWPWGRDRMATLVDRLFSDGATTVGLDIVLAEPDDSSGLVSLDRLATHELSRDATYLAALNGLRGQLDFDGRLAAAMRGRPIVLGYYLADHAAAQGALPAPVMRASVFAGHRGGLNDRSGYGANLPMFQQAAASGGFFNPVIDFDGNVRRIPMLATHGGNVYEALSLAVASMVLGKPDVMPNFGEGGDRTDDALESIDLRTPRGTIRIPVDAEGAALIPYRGYAGSFRYVSAADVLDGRVPPAQLQGRIVLIGTTAPGLQDARSTPVGNVYPGIEIHANLVSGILDGTIKHEPGYANAAQALALLVAGVLMIFLFPWRSPMRATLASALLLAAVVAGDFALWQYGNWVLPLASSVVLIVALFGLNMSLGYFVEAQQRRQFARLFGQYVPRELVDEMSRQPQSYTMNGRRAELTVLFSDVRDFTTIAETLEPEALAHWMNEYLDAMTSVIRTQRGTLDKYIGDAIMAFWGAPLADPLHALHAVLAALQMQQAMRTLNPLLAQRNWPTIEIGIGINTGPMTVGDMGSTVRKAYTVMGDAVNLGSRLEGLTKHYGVGIVVGETTRRQTEGIVYRELDRVRVKGRREPADIYEPLGEEVSVSPLVRAETDRWHRALALYRERDWDNAAAALRELLALQPGNRLYTMYVERLAQMRANPPGPDWDGVHEFEIK